MIEVALPDWNPVMRPDAEWRRKDEEHHPVFIASEAAALHAVRAADMRAGPVLETFLREMEEVWVEKSGANTHADLTEMLAGLKANGHFCYENCFIFNDADSRAWCEHTDGGCHVVFMEDQNSRHAVLLHESQPDFRVAFLSNASTDSWPLVEEVLERLRRRPDLMWSRAGEEAPIAYLRSIHATAVKSLSSLENIAGSAVCELENLRPAVRM